MDKPVYDKMNGKGIVVRGAMWHGDVEDILEGTGDRDFYRKTMR